MNLATFGAVLSFEIKLEEQAASFYANAGTGKFQKVFQDLAKSSKKRANRIERTRLEGIAEMILEPIMGVNGDDYQIQLLVDSDESTLLEQAISLEELSIRFYQDAAKKLPIREVTRTFIRLADENTRRKERLEMLTSEG
jgi:rubrerythrin